MHFLNPMYNTAVLDFPIHQVHFRSLHPSPGLWGCPGEIEAASMALKALYQEWEVVHDSVPPAQARA